MIIEQIGEKSTSFRELEVGDFFLYDGGIYVVTWCDEDGDNAFDLIEQRSERLGDNDLVIPVTVEKITYSIRR